MQNKSHIPDFQSTKPAILDKKQSKGKVNHALNRISYLITMLMQICGDKIQSEKEKFTFLTLCFIHA